MDRQEEVYNTLMNNSEMYASLRILTEQEVSTNIQIKEHLEKELKFFKSKPHKLLNFYPSVNHFLDYICMVKKLD